jgi:hypothetical protein
MKLMVDIARGDPCSSEDVRLLSGLTNAMPPFEHRSWGLRIALSWKLAPILLFDHDLAAEDAGGLVAF